jgi:hypothetical protein
MSALITLLLAAAPCYLPNDVTPGWKQVALPDDARSLSAQGGVDQFRSDGWVTVVDERNEQYLTGEHTFAGRTSFDFVLGEGGQSLEVRFERPLRGAKVDVTAWGPAGTLTLMHEQRVGGEKLSLSWGVTDVRTVTVRVHEHLRESPVVMGFKGVRRVPASRLSESPAFRLPRSLYYLQPIGPAVMLCDDPGAEPAVHPGGPPPGVLPTPVSLRRLEASR